MSCISAILDLRSDMARVLGARMNRVVTGRDENGNPAIVFQGPPPTVISAGKYVTTELWVSDPAAPLPAGADASTREWALEPPAGGACFRIVEIAPDDADQEQDQEQCASAADHEEFQGAHQTDTLDYVTVLRGEVTLVVGDSQVTLRPGDSCVQQPGVPHDWQNRSAETSVMVGVLLSARR
jgi:mannose-6-phosphate isomerase-like protein (cupin superfamily)